MSSATAFGPLAGGIKPEVEGATDRRGGHKRDDPATYRPKEEVAVWLQADPIDYLKGLLVGEPRIGEARLQHIESEVHASIADAIEYAQNSPEPLAESALGEVYAE